MTWYLSVDPMQVPNDLGLDEVGRAQCGFNVMAEKRPSLTLIEELATWMESAEGGQVGTRNVTIFASSSAQLPKELSATPFLTISETGGPEGKKTHNDVTGPAYERPTALLIARGATYAAARALARAAYTSLARVRNRDLSP